MFNIGFGELAIICIVLIIAVGPERLPSMMKTVGKTMRTLRQASRDLRESTGIDEMMREDFDLFAPPRPAPPPPSGPPAVSREEPPAQALPSDGPIAADGAAAAWPHAPLPEPVTEPAHATADAALPSDAPVATALDIDTPSDTQVAVDGSSAAEPLAPAQVPNAVHGPKRET